MSDDALRELARLAGVAARWTDNNGATQIVAVDSLRAILAAMGLSARSLAEISESRARLAGEAEPKDFPPLITTLVQHQTALPFATPDKARAFIEFEQGGTIDVALMSDASGRLCLPAIERIGYHKIFVAHHAFTLAVAPPRCWRVDDIAPGAKMFGLTAQIHALRHSGAGFGDFGAVANFARVAARKGADAIGLSPAHALFAADTHHFTPYSPSSRLFHNILFADPDCVFGAERVRAISAALNLDARNAALDTLELVDWPGGAKSRYLLLRALHADAASQNEAFTRFKQCGGERLAAHALFETLHADQYGRDFTRWHWRKWAPEFRDPTSPQARAFAQANSREIDFHMFGQWLAERSLAHAQGAAREAGMRIGLIADLAIGMNDGGSQAWSRPDELLIGLGVGAPPDMLAPLGQNWGLTTFSPHALRATGYETFLATLRACLRNAGGLRMDHVFGLARLWLVPNGMQADQGAYLAYPCDDLLRLIALESHRHRAIVIGEDLGTAPHDFREKLADFGLAGLRVLQFQRDGDVFQPPQYYPRDVVAMTTTHDTATTAGWWRGHDLEIRAKLNQLPAGQSCETAQHARARERTALWNAFSNAGVAAGSGQPDDDETAPVLDAATRFMARTPAQLVLAPLEDIIGAVEQPNLPGTTIEHPNWRRRYPADAATLLDEPAASARLKSLAARK